MIAKLTDESAGVKSKVRITTTNHQLIIDSHFDNEMSGELDINGKEFGGEEADAAKRYDNLNLLTVDLFKPLRSRIDQRNIQ